MADRGRYPEEAGPEEFQREDTPSDDGEENDSTYPFCPIPSGSEPINIRTPAGSVNGDDINTMCISESPSLSGMDVDVVSLFRLCLHLSLKILSALWLAVHVLHVLDDVHQPLAIHTASHNERRPVQQAEM